MKLSAKILTELTKLFGISVFTLALAVPGLAAAQYDDEYEYEADEGLHEEEWYDTSDWDLGYDDTNIDYETDWWDTSGYGYDYGYDDTYGYYGDTGYYGDYNYYDEGVYDNYDYYTEDWWDTENEFGDWWE